METRHYKEFLNLFTRLHKAGSILSEDNANHDELNLELIDFMKNASEKMILFHFSNENLFGEIKEYLMLNTFDKNGYLVCILRDFIDISSYLNISADKEYCTRNDRPALKMGDTYYSNVYISVHKILERNCHWIEPILDYDTATVPVKYVIECFHAYDAFFKCLDALCLNFEIDLAAIQAKLKLQVFERDNVELRCKGYSEETIKRVVNNNKRDKNLTHDEPDHTELFKALSEYITGINAIEFTILLEHHSLTPGTPKASWIGKRVDAHRFATIIEMKMTEFNNCISFPDGKQLHDKHKDKLKKDSTIIDILKNHFNK